MNRAVDYSFWGFYQKISNHSSVNISAYVCFDSHLNLLFWAPISNRGRYSISSINKQLTICQQILKIWCIDLFFFCNVVKKLVHLKYILDFQFGRLKLAQRAIYLYYLSVVETSPKILSTPDQDHGNIKFADTNAVVDDALCIHTNLQHVKKWQLAYEGNSYL